MFGGVICRLGIVLTGSTTFKSSGMAVNDEAGPAGALEVLGSNPTLDGATDVVRALDVGIPVRSKEVNPAVRSVFLLDIGVALDGVTVLDRRPVVGVLAISRGADAGPVATE